MDREIHGAYRSVECCWGRNAAGHGCLAQDGDLARVQVRTSRTSQRHQESLWREDLQSGGNARTTTATGCAPKELGPSPEPKLLLEIHIDCIMNRKIWRRSYHPSSYHRRRNLEILWRFARRILNYQRRLPIADVFRRFRGKRCRFWSRRWRVAKITDFTTVRPESFGETRCNGHAGERQVHNTHKPIERKVWVLTHQNVRERRWKPIHCLHQNRENWSEVLFSSAHPSNLRGSLFESDKDHLLALSSKIRPGEARISCRVPQ